MNSLHRFSLALTVLAPLGVVALDAQAQPFPALFELYEHHEPVLPGLQAQAEHHARRG